MYERYVKDISVTEAIDLLVKHAHQKHDGYMRESPAMGGKDIYWFGCPKGDPTEIVHSDGTRTKASELATCTCGADHANNVIEALGKRVMDFVVAVESED